MSEEAQAFVLPPSLMTKAELSKLILEVEAIELDLESQKARGQANDGYHLPVLSSSLSEFIEINKIDLTDSQVMATLKKRLRIFRDKAPVIHLTFASSADPQSLEHLVAWIRQELHPQALVSVGLQPALIGGVHIRTPNHIHDFSMRALFKGKTDVLLKDIEGLA